MSRSSRRSCSTSNLVTLLPDLRASGDTGPDGAGLPDGRGLSTTRRVLALAAIGVVSALLVAGLYVSAVRTRTGQRADEAAMIGRSTQRVVQETATELLDTVSVLTLAAAVVGLGLLAVIRRRPRLAIGVAVMVIGANLTTQGLKSFVLNRPDLLHRPEAASNPSFPSGHATIAMTLGLGFMLVVPARFRTVAGLVGITYATLIGAGTLTAQWHRPSDVIAAYLIAAVWASALAIWLVSSRGTGRSRPRRPTLLGRSLSTRRLITTGSWLLGTALVVSVAVALALRGRPLVPMELRGSYVAAVASMAGVGLFLLGAFLGALRGALLDPPAADRAL